MRSEYDFTGSVENSYVRKPHGQVTMNLDDDVIRYFTGQVVESVFALYKDRWTVMPISA